MGKRYALITFGIIIFLVLASTITIFFARGYRIDFKKKEVTGTGIIAVSSVPDGALVYLNNVPTSATNTSITSLKPGSYQIRLEKEGFTTYEKRVTVEKEFVSSVNALLVRSVPELKPLTFTNARKPNPSPDGQKIVFSSTQAGIDGIWLLDLSERPFNLSNRPTLLIKDTTEEKFSDKKITWSPDSKMLLINNKYLFDITAMNFSKDIDVENLKSSWQKEEEVAKEKLLESFPKEIKEKVISLGNVTWSPDDTKIYYEKEGKIIVFDLKPKNLRQKEPCEYTVYEKKGGKFTKIYWYPDSQHLLILEKDSLENETGAIKIIEIDGENEMQIFTGTVISDYLFSYTNGSKIVILTTFNPEAQQYNLYSINLR